MLSDPNPPDWTLISRIVSGEAGAEDVARLEQWIAGDVSRQLVVQRARAMWAGAALREPAVDVEAALVRIKHSVTVGAPAAHGFALAHPSRGSVRLGGAFAPRPWVLGRMAAVLAFGVVGTAIWFGVSARSGRSHAVPVTMSEVVTRRGEHARLRLPDGTEVVLAPASSIRYTSDYGVRHREITLDGEALFTVTHDAERPFLVRTRHAMATDLGTTFVVRAYATDPATDVVVAEGSVHIARLQEYIPGVDIARRTPEVSPFPSHDSSVVLGAGDFVRISQDGMLRVRRHIATDPYFAWVNGRLAFDGATLADAASQLGRWYDITVVIADSAIGQRHLTGSYDEESWGDVVRLIAASLDVRVERSGRTVTFRSR